jgi:2-C-methyl-D-erythritol 4-phosphate cytidylyltransferase
MTRNAALVTGAGNSSRMGQGGKKEYRLIQGTPVLARSLLAFQGTGLFTRIVVTVPPGGVEEARNLVAPFLPVEAILFVAGGDTRRESVYRGLSALVNHDIEYVLIHDAARPWVTVNLIRAVFEATRSRGAAIPVTETPDALVETTPDHRVCRHISKTMVRSVQTPQGFRFREILAAHEAIRDEPGNYYDDAQVLMKAGKNVSIVPGEPANRKITFVHDLE